MDNVIGLLIILGYCLVSSVVCVLVDRATGAEVRGDSGARVLHYKIEWYDVFGDEWFFKMRRRRTQAREI